MKKTSPEVEQYILELLSHQYTSREVADIVGVGKSTVNDIRNRNKNTTQQTEDNSPRILFLDIETAPSVAVTFDRWNANFTRKHILREGGWLITAAWSWQGEDKIYGAAVTREDTKTGNDVYVVENLIEAIEEADIIVGHYIKKFDIPTIRSRCLINGLHDIKPVKIVDTCELAKSMKFNTNKLDDLCAYLGIEQSKIPTEISLWVECANGNQFAIDKMLEYNKQDIVLQKLLYERLKGFDRKSPNMGVMQNKFACPSCGSENVTSTGWSVFRGQTEYQEYSCDDCGKRSRTNKKGNFLINQ